MKAKTAVGRNHCSIEKASGAQSKRTWRISATCRSAVMLDDDGRAGDRGAGTINLSRLRLGIKVSAHEIINVSGMSRHFRSRRGGLSAWAWAAAITRRALCARHSHRHCASRVSRVNRRPTANFHAACCAWALTTVVRDVCITHILTLLRLLALLRRRAVITMTWAGR